MIEEKAEFDFDSKDGMVRFALCRLSERRIFENVEMIKITEENFCKEERLNGKCE